MSASAPPPGGQYPPPDSKAAATGPNSRFAPPPPNSAAAEPSPDGQPSIPADVTATAPLSAPSAPSSPNAAAPTAPQPGVRFASSAPQPSAAPTAPQPPVAPTAPIFGTPAAPAQPGAAPGAPAPFSKPPVAPSGPALGAPAPGFGSQAPSSSPAPGPAAPVGSYPPPATGQAPYSAGPGAPGQFGAPQFPMAGQPVTPLSPEEAAERSRKLRRRLIWIGSSVAAVLILVVAGAVTINLVNSRMYGPEAQAEDFFAALEKGSASDALDLANLDLTDDETIALTDEIYSEAQSRPTDIKVTDTSIVGSYATMEVEYKQGNKEVTDTVMAQRTGKTNVFFDVWEITTWTIGDIYTSVSYGTTTLELNGVAIDTGSIAAIPVFPGEYSLSLQSDSSWLEPAAQTVTVYGTESATAPDLTLTPAEGFQEQAQNTVNGYIDTCIASTALAPSSCPNRSWSLADVTGITWTLDSRPTITIEQDSDDPTSFTVRAVGGGATVNGTYAADTYFGNAGDAVSAQTDLDFIGVVTVSGDDISFTYLY